MRIKKQDEILQLKVRKEIIQSIEGSENKLRKNEAYRRAQCMKDKTNQEVRKLLLQQFSSTTVTEMSYAITNLSIVKKVIKKLARVYKDGVTRVVDGDKKATENIAELAEILRYNERAKTQNRITRLQKNAVMYIKPCQYFDNEGEMYMRPRPSVLQPYLYDVVEDFYDRTQPLVYVLSNYDPNSPIYTDLDPARVREPVNQANLVGQQRSTGNRVDEVIADKKEDEEEANGKEYIWWSGKYHFTTNSLGQVVRADGSIVPDPVLPAESGDYDNPIEMLPFANTTRDQDNSFWAEGGEDLVDGAIVVNSLMTQNNHIAVTQGYGQYYMTGKNLPENVEVGPTRMIKLEHETDAGDPQPQVGVINASPPLTELQNSILSQVALILTTNDLSTSGLSGQLDGGANFASGVALVIDKSESLEDVDDDREVAAAAEKESWKIIAAFMQHWSEEEVLDPELEEYILPEEFELIIEFGEPKVIASEAEKLQAIKTRAEIGLNTKAELIMMDRRDMDEKQAKAKIEEINKEKEENMKAFSIEPNPEDEDGPNVNKDNQDESDESDDE